jgi:hypothetical protein
LANEFGDELATLHVNSARDIAEAGIAVLELEAVSLLKNPAVKKAYDHFLLVAKLTSDAK